MSADGWRKETDQFDVSRRRILEAKQLYGLTESELGEIEEFDANATARRRNNLELVDGTRPELCFECHVDQCRKFGRAGCADVCQ